MTARSNQAVRVIAVCSFVTIGVLGVALGARSAPKDPVRTVRVDVATAKSAVEGLLTPAERGGLSVSPPVAGAVDSFYEVRSESARGTVDVNDGHVTSLFRQTKLPTGRDANLSVADAQAAGLSWLSSHDIPIDGLSATTDLVDHGDTTAYTVSLTRVVDGVLLPDTRTVYVNASSGEIFMLADFRHPFDPPPAPKVSVDQANANAISTAGGRNAAIERDVLMVAFAADGSQRLVWQVAVGVELDESSADQPVVAHFLIEVDALDGSARVVAQG